MRYWAFLIENAVYTEGVFFCHLERISFVAAKQKRFF